MTATATPEPRTGLFKRAGDGLLASFGLLATLLALVSSSDSSRTRSRRCTESHRVWRRLSIHEG